MRYSLLIGLVLLGGNLVLDAQNLSYWQYTDGQLDTGMVRGLHLRTKGERGIRLYRVDTAFQGVFDKLRYVYKPLVLLVKSGDTLLIQREIEGKNRLLHKLYSGEVDLYRDLDSHFEKRYYLEIEGTYHSIHNSRTRQLLADEFLSGKNKFFNTKKLTNSYHAVELASQFDRHLSGTTKRNHRRNYFLGHNRIGIAYNLRNAPQLYDRPISPFIQLEDEYFIQHPALSLTYERQLNRRLPWFYGQLQCRFYRQNKDHTWWKHNPGAPPSYDGTNVSDFLEASNFYVYPGLLFEFRQRRHIRPFIAMGAAIAQPIKFYRKVETSGFSSLPSLQTIENIQSVSFGRYREAGVRINFYRKFAISFSLRWEKLKQNRRMLDLQVVDTFIFRNYPVLAEEKQIQGQLQLQYSW